MTSGLVFWVFKQNRKALFDEEVVISGITDGRDVAGKTVLSIYTMGGE